MSQESEARLTNALRQLTQRIEENGPDVIKNASTVTGMSPNTIRRWVNGESQPQRLDQTIERLEYFLGRFERPEGDAEEEGEKTIPAMVYRSVFESLTQKRMSGQVIFSLFSLVLQSLAEQLDPHKNQGLQISVLQCSQSTSEGVVRSLRERFTLNSAFSTFVSERGFFFGKGTPEANVCLQRTPIIISTASDETVLLPLLREETCVAGCLRLQHLVPPGQNVLREKRTLPLLQEYANLCSLLFPEYYAFEELCFQPIPTAQNHHDFVQSVARLLASAAEAGNILSPEEAEQAIWHQREQDLLFAFQESKTL